MLVLGVDPGSLKTGWGVVRAEGRRFALVAYGVVRPRAGTELAARLALIHDGLAATVAQYRPEAVAIEAVFTHKNARSALILGHARGVALLALHRAGLVVAEYPPTHVKKTLTGRGQATKDQIQFMVRRVLNLTEKLPEDAADALAVALCRALQPGVKS